MIKLLLAARRFFQWVLAPIVLLSMVSATGHTERPIIGVLTTPLISSECITAAQRLDTPLDGGASCFHSLYVKWIESAGGRVVPLLYNAPPAVLDTVFDSLNGVLFTGGELNVSDLTSPYMQAAGRLLKRAVTASQAGEHVPVWGTCMGLQTLSLLIAEDSSVLKKGVFDSESLMLPLELASPDIVNKSRMTRSFSVDVLRWLTSENVTVNLHHDGVSPQEFKVNSRLSSFFRVVSTNKDRHHQPFVSTIEGRTTPVYGVQWHPERPQFQFSDSAGENGINHSEHAIEAMQAVANFFVSEARLNGRHFVTPQEESQHLIYNWAPSGLPGDSYQAYVFNLNDTRAESSRPIFV